MSSGNTRGEVNWGRAVSFAVLLAIIIATGILFFRVMRGFLLPLFLAVLLVVIFRPVYNAILRRFHGRKWIAAMLTTLLVGLSVQIPFSWAVILAIKEGAELTTRKWDIADRLDQIRTRLGLTIPYREFLEEIDELVWQVVPAGVDQPALLPDDSKLELLQQLDLKSAELSERFAAGARDADNQRPRLVAARADLELLRESIEEAIQAAHALQRTPTDRNSHTDLEDAIGRIGIRFGNMRDDLLGGFPRSHLLRFANPQQQELETWRTQIGAYLGRSLISLTGRIGFLGKIVFGLVIMLVAVYYFLIDGPDMIKAIMRLSPLDDAYEEELFKEFAQVSRAVVLATLLTAVIQGLLAGIGYYFAGLQSVVLLTVLTIVLAMVPFVGAAAVWVPAAAYLMFIADRMGAGIGLAIYGALVVSMSDNIVKPYILHGQSNIHPLWALLSVLGGVQALGPIGILVGPMVVAFLQALLNILQRELSGMGAASSRQAAIEKT